MNPLLNFFLVGGILATLLIIVLLFKNKSKGLPQHLLIAFFTVLLFELTNSYADLHSLPILYLLTLGVGDIVVWLAGPLLYLYIQSLFQKNDRFMRRKWYHFIGTTVYFVTITIPIFIYIFTETFVFPYFEFLFHNDIIIFFIEDIYLIGYILLSLRSLKRYRKAMKLNYSNLDDNDFSWVKYLLLGSLFVISIDFTFDLYEVFLGEITWEAGHITMIALVLVIGYLGYYGVNQTNVLLPDFLMKNEDISEEKEKTNHLSNTCTIELKTLQSKLEKVLMEEKPYLDEDLTLSKLAYMIPTTDKKLSALLNQYMDTTFYDIINAYRVEAVKEKMNSIAYDNYTLLGIALESGFNSKTTFNRIFKKETGVSPSEFKKTLHPSNISS